MSKGQKLKYSEAKEKCKHTLKYDLASVFSREETKYLGNMTVQINPDIGKKSFNFPWIGLHKNAYAPTGNNCYNMLEVKRYYIIKSLTHLCNNILFSRQALGYGQMDHKFHTQIGMQMSRTAIRYKNDIIYEMIRLFGRYVMILCIDNSQF